MFVSMTTRLKSMGNVRIGYGLRITKRNAPYMLIAMLFVLMFRAMWYLLVGACWVFYGIFWLYYKAFKLAFKAIKIAIVKIKEVVSAKRAEQRVD